jgi:hypothetical protein
MNNKNLTIGLLITLVIAVCGLFFPKVVGKFGAISNGVDGGTTNFTSLSVQNGVSVGGLFTTATRVAMATGTTTVCAIQSPNATTTLTEASALFTVSSASASTVYLAKATTAFATTTSLGFAALAAGAQGTVIASTTPSSVTVDGAQVFAPNSWFVVGMTGLTTYSPTGVCTAEFQVMQ